MLAWFLHIGKEKEGYKNHRSKTYRETTRGAGVYDALQLQGVQAESMPSQIVQVERLVIEEDSRTTIIIRALGQPLGKAVCGERHEALYNKSGQGAKPFMESSDKEAVREAIANDRLSVKNTK